MKRVHEAFNEERLLVCGDSGPGSSIFVDGGIVHGESNVSPVVRENGFRSCLESDLDQIVVVAVASLRVTRNLIPREVGNDVSRDRLETAAHSCGIIFFETLFQQSRAHTRDLPLHFVEERLRAGDGQIVGGHREELLELSPSFRGSCDEVLDVSPSDRASAVLGFLANGVDLIGAYLRVVREVAVRQDDEELASLTAWRQKGGQEERRIRYDQSHNARTLVAESANASLGKTGSRAGSLAVLFLERSQNVLVADLRLTSPLIECR